MTYKEIFMDDLDKILSLAEKSTGGIESIGNTITQIYSKI